MNHTIKWYFHAAYKEQNAYDVMVNVWASATFCGKNGVSVGSQSVQHTVFSGAYIITVLQCVYPRLILQLCESLGRLASVLTTGDVDPR